MSPSASECSKFKKKKKMVVDMAEIEEKRQCNFFVEKRKRFCRLIPGKGKRFCGEHINQEKDNTSNLTETNQQSSGRIPCPYDPNHTVAVKQLAKHFKVCNSRPREQPAYYKKGINGGLLEHDEKLKSLRLSSFSLQEIQQIISKVKSVYADHVGNIDTQILHHEALKSELDNPDNGTSARKHLLQINSLLGHMKRLDLLGPNTCYVELGAGRGRLSQWIQQAMEDLDKTSFLLIDRSAVRHKRDAFYQREDGGPQFERISMDIENLVLGKVPTVCSQNRRPVVAYTKHLCGVATDLALRCLMETRKIRSQNIKEDSSQTPVSTNKSTEENNSFNQQAATLPKPLYNTLDNPQFNSDSSQKDLHLQSEMVSTNFSSTNVQDTSCINPKPQQQHPGTDSNMHECNAKTREITQSEKRPLESNPVKGIVMALCCHHQCSWRSHVGKEFFKEVGFSEREFMALVRLTSWATCGTRTFKNDGRDGRMEKDVKKVDGRKDNGNDGQKMGVLTDEGLKDLRKEALQDGSSNKEREDITKKERKLKSENMDLPEEQESIVSFLGLSIPEREEIGFKCKRILDMGRLIYLRNYGLEAKLVYYVERNISPENAVLVATPAGL